MILIDTGYLVAVLRPADELHRRAVAWAAAVRDTLVVTEYVLVETINLLSSPVERQAAHRMLAEVQADVACQVVYASRPILEAGVRLHSQRSDKSWSLTDCVSFHVMSELGITQALAYDHHFEQAGYEALLRREP